MPNIIHIVNGSCEINLDPMLLHEMPVKNWRKLVKLAAADWRNQESLQELRDWFSLAVQDAKVAWETASREFANGWKDPMIWLSMRLWIPLRCTVVAIAAFPSTSTHSRPLATMVWLPV